MPVIDLCSNRSDDEDAPLAEHTVPATVLVDLATQLPPSEAPVSDQTVIPTPQALSSQCPLMRNILKKYLKRGVVVLGSFFFA